MSQSEDNNGLFVTEGLVYQILRILVKAQPSTRSTGPRSPTRLGIQSQDLALPNEYNLGHRGISAASGCKLAFTTRHYRLFFLMNMRGWGQGKTMLQAKSVNLTGVGVP